MASSKAVILTNGAQNSNIFWQVTGNKTLVAVLNSFALRCRPSVLILFSSPLHLGWSSLAASWELLRNIVFSPRNPPKTSSINTGLDFQYGGGGVGNLTHEIRKPFDLRRRPKLKPNLKIYVVRKRPGAKPGAQP